MSDAFTDGFIISFFVVFFHSDGFECSLRMDVLMCFCIQVPLGVACIWSVSMMFLVVCVASGIRFHYVSDVTKPIGCDLTCDTLLQYFCVFLVRRAKIMGEEMVGDFFSPSC